MDPIALKESSIFNSFSSYFIPPVVPSFNYVDIS